MRVWEGGEARRWGSGRRLEDHEDQWDREDRPSLGLERQSFLGDRSNHWNRGDLEDPWHQESRELLAFQDYPVDQQLHRFH